MNTFKKQLASSLGLLVLALMVGLVCISNACAQTVPSAQGDTNALRAYFAAGDALTDMAKSALNKFSYNGGFLQKVPVGKRFVIERVTGVITTPSDQALT